MAVPRYQYLKAVLVRQGRVEDLPQIQRALAFARKAHKEQKRSSGEDFIVHPLACAITLAKMQMDTNTIVAGLLHDVSDDTPITIQDIKQEFGDDVAQLVDGVTKLGKVKYRGMERHVENLRKMFIAMVRDIRVILIKFADRLHNLKTIEYLPAEKQKRIANETLEIYAPIANRLGMGEMRDKLEDLSFRILNPKEYHWLKNIITTRYKEKRGYLKKIQRRIGRELARHHISILDIHGRNKHLYSLYKALLERERDITRVYDLMALRIIVETVGECYSVLGVIHTLWKPLKGHIKDYIAQPKNTGYQSLHTTVFCDGREIVEFQIRTQSMHNEAEHGITAQARWHYNEKKDAVLDKKLAWVRELSRWQKRIKDPKQMVEAVKVDVFRNRIFVFTPRGDALDLPEGSTPVDLAYHIHSDIGDQCVGAKINNRIVPLDTVLHNGDVGEILLSKQKKEPDPNWLTFVKTTTARSKIKIHVRGKFMQRIKTILTVKEG